jgi:tetratricopeptide (TPR) repeat protein
MAEHAAMRGDATEAIRLREEALAIHRRTGNRLGMAYALNFLASLHFMLGRHDEAVADAERAAALAAEVQDRLAGLWIDEVRGELAFSDGDVAGARKRWEEVLAGAREVNEPPLIRRALGEVGSAMAAQGQLALARERQEESLALSEREGAAEHAAMAKRYLAELALDEGRPAEAEPLARTALETLRKAGARDMEPLARAALVRALAGQGKSAEARAEADAAPALADLLSWPQRRLVTSVAVAQARAASGLAPDLDAAVALLERTVAEARRLRFVPEGLEARLALGEVRIRSGRATPGRSELRRLAADARDRGFLLVARQAEAAAR